MRKCLLAIVLGAMCCCSARANDSTTQDNDLSNLVGRVFLILSKDNVVSGQTKGVVSLWVDAKLGVVQEPIGKNPNSRTVPRSELVPDSYGIVLHFYGPYNANEIQKVWTAWHNAKTRHFEFALSTPAGLIGIQGWYGHSFSIETVDQLLALSPNPVASQ
jgi:hypothetical protein